MAKPVAVGASRYSRPPKGEASRMQTLRGDFRDRFRKKRILAESGTWARMRPRDR